MVKGLKNLCLILLLNSTMACALSSKLRLYRDSTLNNLNPAPDKLAPKEINGSKSIDPTFVQSKADYHFALAESYSLEGHTKKATEEYQKVLLYDPDSAEVRLKLSAEFLRQGLVTESVEQAEFVVKSHPKNVDARLLLAGLYASMKLYDLSVSQYQMVVELEPENEEAPLFIGAILAEKKDYDQAIEYFKGLVKTGNKKDKHKYYYYIGRIYLERGKDYNKQAEEYFTKALGADPKYEDAVLALASLYKSEEKVYQTTELLASFNDKFGPSQRVSTALSQLYIEQESYEKAFEQLEILESYERQNLSLKSRMASLLIELKKYNRAVEILEEILVISPNSNKIRFRAGAVYEEMKEYKKAIGHLELITPESTYYPEAMIHVSYMHKLNGDTSKANDVIEEAIKTRRDVPQFYAYYASLLDEQKEYVKARNILVGAVKEFPSDVQLKFYLGSIYDRLGETEKTISEMKKVIELDDNHTQALNYLAYLYADRNEFLDEAEVMARRALENKPEDGYILDTMGWVLFKQGRVKEAIKYLEAAYKQKNTESIIAEHLGDAYYKYDLSDKAYQMYLQAVENEKDDGKIAKIKAKIVAIEKQRQKTQRTPASVQEAKSDKKN